MDFQDIKADTFDRIDGKMWLYNSENPKQRYEVVSLLDSFGDDTDDEEIAAGGVVKIAEEHFRIFHF